MALLDFVQNRNTQVKPPEPAKQPITAKTIQGLSQADQAKFQEAKALLEKATAHRQPKPEAPAEDGSNAAMLQKANGQEKTQAALSPTDNFKGKTALQPEKAKAPEKSQTPQQSQRPSRGISR